LEVRSFLSIGSGPRFGEVFANDSSRSNAMSAVALLKVGKAASQHN
jgi:hypothetical protein